MRLLCSLYTRDVEMSCKIVYNRSMNPLLPRERYTERACPMCGCRYCDSTASYCRTCTNQYAAWRYRQRKKNLPTTVTEYRKQTGKVKKAVRYLPARTEANVAPTEQVAYEQHTSERLKECPVCRDLHHNSNSRIYCKPCHSAYQLWAKQRHAAGLNAPMDLFRQAIDGGWVVPKRDASHQGRVVRGI